MTQKKRWSLIVSLSFVKSGGEAGGSGGQPSSPPEVGAGIREGGVDRWKEPFALKEHMERLRCSIKVP